MTARKKNPVKGNFSPHYYTDDLTGTAGAAPIAPPAQTKPFEPVEEIMQRYYDRLNDTRTRTQYQAKIAKAQAVRDLEKEYGWITAINLINQALVW